ncbi:MAG TPA: DUF2339 domain-containing protein [Allosphingosinicella sp.]|jgi:uncharacterized membrane protein
MEPLLLLALVALAVAHFRLAGRTAALEREVERLGFGEPPPEPPPLAARAAGGPPPPSASATRPAAAPAPSRTEWVGAAEAAVGKPAPARPHENLGGLFERYVGGRLLIWIGGIALAVAGIFLVRYSIEIGLVTPPVRMGIAAAFGLLLLGAGELARSRPGGLVDPRVAQSLVGAGILVLYATPYGSLVLYQLISMSTASALMVMVTLIALVLSLRHGAPTAVMGLAGGFATPLLVGDPHAGAVPLLAYLGLLDIALFTIAGRRGWTWLAAGAVLLSFAWTASLVAAPRADALAGGAFIVLLGVAGSLVRAGKGWQLDFVRPAAIGLLELAVLIGRTDIGPLAWSLYGALSLAAFFLATRRPEHRPVPALALAGALVLLFMKALDSRDWAVPWAAAAITLLFAGGGTLLALRRRREALLWTATACAAAAGPAMLLRTIRPALLDRPLWGVVFAALAAVPLLLAWARRNAAGETDVDRPLFVAGAAALLLLGLGLGDLLPRLLAGAGWMLLGLGAAAAARRLGDRGLSVLTLATAAFVALWSIAMVPGLWATLAGSLFGQPALAAGLPGLGRSLQVLLLPALLMMAAWAVLPHHYTGVRPALLAAAAGFAVASAYVAFKQAFGLQGAADFVARGFAERTLITQALFAGGWLVCTGRLKAGLVDERRRWLAGIALTALAAARLLWFDLIVDNPALVPQSVGHWPVLNLLAPAYLLSAFWLYRARRGADSPFRSGAWLVLALAALIAGVMLMVRQLFHGAILTGTDVAATESYGYSLAALLLSLALLLSGVRLPDKALRLAGLILLTATALKVFLVDASALQGLLRILSFMGLGVALIGIGKLYTTVLDAEARPAEESG